MPVLDIRSVELDPEPVRMADHRSTAYLHQLVPDAAGPERRRRLHCHELRWQLGRRRRRSASQLRLSAEAVNRWIHSSRSLRSEANRRLKYKKKCEKGQSTRFISFHLALDMLGKTEFK